MARQDFIDELQELGFKIVELGNNRISFDYFIPIGPFQGQAIKLGFIANDDLPANPPSGPHVSPQILPITGGGGEHPKGGIHKSDFGPEWEYWSRPYNGWNQTDRSARIYMSHIRHLFETQ